MRYHVIGLVALMGLLSACQSVTKDAETKVVAMNEQLTLGHWYSVNGNCSARPVSVQVVTPPKHGQVSTAMIKTFPDFASTDALAACDKRRIDSIAAIYKPDTDFRGTDSVDLKIIFPGEVWSPRYSIQVK